MIDDDMAWDASALEDLLRHAKPDRIQGALCFAYGPDDRVIPTIFGRDQYNRQTVVPEGWEIPRDKLVQVAGTGAAFLLVHREALETIAKLEPEWMRDVWFREEWMPLRSDDFYQEHDIRLVGGRVTSIDTVAKTVVVDDGTVIDYDALLLATGAEPRLLPVPGADLAHVHYLRTLADSRSIIAALDGTSAAVVIGAGFIGLEVAASLRHREVPVTVVNIDEVPEARAIVKQLNGGYASVPTLLFPDGTQLTEPSVRQVRQKLGLEQKDGTLLDRVWGLFGGKE